MKYSSLIIWISLVVIGLGREAAAEPEAKRPFKGFGEYTQDLRGVCQAIASDGRLAKLLDLAKAHAERDPECESCRPLFQQFHVSCANLKPIVAAKKGPKPADTETPSTDDAAPQPTPTVTPYIVEREPSTLVLDRVTRMFNKVAEDKDSNVRAIPGIQKLVFVLRDKHEVAVGAEAEYFDTLAEYIYAPFAELAEKQSKSEQKSLEASPEKKEKNLGSMFEE